MKQELEGTVSVSTSKPGLKVLKALPVILEIVQFGNLMAFGFVANQPAFYLLAVSNMKKSIQARSSVHRKRSFHRYFMPGRQVVYYLTFATGLFLVMLNK